MDVSTTLLSNNIWGTKISHKRIKLFEYLKRNAIPIWIVFLQKMHSSEKDEIRRTDKFKG